MAADGTIYCYANPSGTSSTLFKSTDAGRSWSPTGWVQEAIVDIVTVADDANLVYYSSLSTIYKSTDAGTSFTPLPPNPGGAGGNNVEITSIDVTRVNGSSIIAVATRDADDSEYGGVYILDENEPFVRWTDTGIGNYDVYAVAFSPGFAADRQLVAVATDEQDTWITTRINDTGWGEFIAAATIAGLSPTSATVAFPDNHSATSGDYALFVAIDTGNDGGDVFLVNGAWASGSSTATDLNIGTTYSLSSVDVTGLAVSGTSLLAGAADSAQVYISHDGGINWARSSKAPTGQYKTYLLMAPDFTGQGTAYAVTSGTESAFSYTADGGVTWSQVGLIDARISQNGIIDLAVSPTYDQDNSLFMLTFDGVYLEHSLWRSQNGGARWERVLTSTQAGNDSIKLVELSPQYGSGSQVVFLITTSGGNSAIWKSTDNGDTFTHREAPFSIDTWAVVNDDSLFLGSYDGSHGLVYGTINSGFFYSPGAVTGSQPLKSIALSPGYEQDRTLLAGNTNGWVYLSQDNGTSFNPLPPYTISPPLTGNITVTFDPKFSSNKVIYAASDSQATTGNRERLYRFIIGQSNTWEDINSALPAGSILSQLTASADGTLYTINSQQTDAAGRKGGMERSLNPAYPLDPTFETVIRGLADGATLNGLWLRGSQLWSIDTTNTGLVTYIDSLARPVTLTSPAEAASGVGIENIDLEWERLEGATEYQWQLGYDADFSTVATGFEGNTGKSSARLPALEKARTYYWRVRATQPVLSPWSAQWSFTTSPASTIIAPELYNPKAGADGVPIEPVFRWNAVAGANSYELLVSTDASFSNLIIVKSGDSALPATAWQSDISLDYNTTYYWKVRASTASSHSTWSAVGIFVTSQPPPTKTSPPPEPTVTASPQQLTPSSPPPSPPPPPLIQSAIPDWAIYLVGALLLSVVLLLITVLVLVLKIKRFNAG